ncbi:hypothetical protein Lalb_Chr24g0396671 [Lupinus albus]|uniref:Uncharacterized protein n=1 Tax=Lupinus albus TaxID=3870 RepID=A0A6A4MZ17_LUPAL|nr:hypothetical protein Lalb_Chr24g0396671 [Lupinus albus]
MQMMWASDFDESLASDLEEKCLDALALDLRRGSSNDMREEIVDTDDGNVKSGSQSNHNKNDGTKASLQSNLANTNHSACDVKLKSLSSHAFCGWARNIWPKNDRVQIRTISSLTRKGKDELSIFCVAAILVLNRQKIIQETNSFDDMIKAGAIDLFKYFLSSKAAINWCYENHSYYTLLLCFCSLVLQCSFWMFNDNMLKIKVKRCITTAVKLRKKYFNKASSKFVIFLYRITKEALTAFAIFCLVKSCNEKTNCRKVAIMCWSTSSYSD